MDVHSEVVGSMTPRYGVLYSLALSGPGWVDVQAEVVGSRTPGYGVLYSVALSALLWVDVHSRSCRVTDPWVWCTVQFGLIGLIMGGCTQQKL